MKATQLKRRKEEETTGECERKSVVSLCAKEAKNNNKKNLPKKKIIKNRKK